MNLLIFSLLAAAIYFIIKETYQDMVDTFKEPPQEHKCVIIPFPELKIESERGAFND